MNTQTLREKIEEFDFNGLFVEGLGWNQPTISTNDTITINGDATPCRCVAEIGQVPVLKFDLQAFNTFKSNSKRFHKKIKEKHHKHLALFTDNNSFFSLSYLSKEEQVRTHDYFKGQTGDYFISKLSGIHFGMEDEPRIIEIGNRLETAFNTEKVTKRFYEDFRNNHFQFQKYISGLKTEEEKKWYASLILNRLMFIWFLQKKGFVNDDDFDYLPNKLAESKQRGKDRYYQEFLTLLFFEGFAKKPIERSPKAKTLLGKIKYLNGGLFVPHAIEEKYEIKSNSAVYKTKIKIQDKAFEETFNIFSGYDWCLEGKQGKSDNEISPDVMGYIFEKYINELQQKSLGAFYTRDEITGYLSRNTIQKSILEKVNKQGYTFQTIEELLHKLDATLCKKLLTNENSILNTLTVLDPVVGSGAFLTAAMKELINIYSPIIGKIETSGDRELKKWLKDFKEKHKSVLYGIKKNIILKNLYGVDIMKEAVEVCKLRLFLSLVSSALSQNELEPLPNMDFNILCGNSLIGFLRESEEEQETQKAWSEVLGEDYIQIKDKYNRMVSKYKNQPLSFIKLKELKSKTNQFLEENSQKLSRALADKCNSRKSVKYPKILDIQGKKKTIKKRPVEPEDFYSKEGGRNLNPFHWDFAFNEIMERGGFDVIITNPPWEKVKIEDREFFHRYDSSIDKKKTKGEVLKKKKNGLLKKTEIAEDYKKTEEFYLFQRNYFSGLYQYQAGEITNLDDTTKQASADMDTYRLFTERCFDLLSTQGFLGIVLPSGLCKDDGAIGLRKELLFSKTQITGLIDFQNQMENGKGKIFEGVDARFKFLLLNLQKAKPKEQSVFPTQFHTQDLKVLEHFPNNQCTSDRSKHVIPTKLEIQPKKHNSQSKTVDNKGTDTNIIHRESTVAWQSIEEIKKLCPYDYSIIEFKNPKDKEIFKKVLQFPKIGENLKNRWNPVFYTELHETNDSHLFKNKKSSSDDLHLYKGSAIYQYEFNYALSHINRHVNLKSPKIQGKGFPFKNKCYKDYRLVIRTIAGNTNERSLISTVIPKNNFISNSLHGVYIESNNFFKRNQYMLLLQAFLNSFVVDYCIRQKVSSNINKKYITSLYIPRLTEKDDYFKELVERSAKLTCIGKEFDELADEIGIKGGVTNQQKRWRIQGEIDAMVAYVYGLTQEEFKYILDTFTTGKNQERLKALREYAFKAFKKNDFLPKAS